MGRPKKETVKPFKPQMEECPARVLDFISTHLHGGFKLLTLEGVETEYVREYGAVVFFPLSGCLGIMNYTETLDGMELRANTVFVGIKKMMEWGKKALEISEALKNED